MYDIPVRLRACKVMLLHAIHAQRLHDVYMTCRKCMHITDGEHFSIHNSKCMGLCAENRGYYGIVCVEIRSSNEAREINRKFAINRRGRLGFLSTLQKIAVSDPARGSNPTFLLGQKRRVRPASRGW